MRFIVINNKMSLRKNQGVLYSPEVDSILDGCCSYSKNNPKLKIQRLLRSKIMEKNQKSLVLKKKSLSIEDRDEEFEANLTRKRRKSFKTNRYVTEGKVNCNRDVFVGKKSFSRYKTFEAETIEAMKAKINQTINHNLIGEAEHPEDRQKNRKSMSPRRMHPLHPLKKHLVEAVQQERETLPMGYISLHVKQAPVDIRSRYGTYHKLKPLFSKMEIPKDLGNRKPLDENFFSISEKKELFEKKASFNHISFGPTTSKNQQRPCVKSMKKINRSTDFSPWDFQNLKQKEQVVISSLFEQPKL